MKRKPILWKFIHWHSKDVCCRKTLFKNLFSFHQKDEYTQVECQTDRYFWLFFPKLFPFIDLRSTGKKDINMNFIIGNHYFKMRRIRIKRCWYLSTLYKSIPIINIFWVNIIQNIWIKLRGKWRKKSKLFYMRMNTLKLLFETQHNFPTSFAHSIRCTYFICQNCYITEMLSGSVPLFSCVVSFGFFLHFLLSLLFHFFLCV